MNDNSELFSVFVWIVLIGAFVLGSVTCSMSACERTCQANGDKANYEMWGGGCWCRDKAGRYKPEDSRSQGRE